VISLLRLLPVLLCICSLTDASAATRRKKKTEPAPVAPALRKIPSAAGKPNVLFIVVDDLNDWVGWMGGHPQTQTPHMDRLARMGCRFTNAHTAYALCNPSRTAMLTGMAPWKSGVTGNEQDWRYAATIQGKWTLPECFRLNGYTTAAGGKIFHANHGGPEGRLSGWHGGRRGFEQDAAWDQRFPSAGVQLADLPIHTGQNFNGLDIWHWDWKGTDTPEEKTDDAQTVAWAADFLASQSETKKKPFFLAVGIYRPHSPWYVPQSYFDAFPLDQIQLPTVQEGDLNDIPAVAKKPSPHHDLIQSKGLWKAAVQAYLANVAFADAQIGKLLAALENSPAGKNTIICLTSDHGWYLGQKKQWHKGKLWEPATHVPLTISAPGITQPDSVCSQPVSLMDLYPTLVELTKVERPSHLDGTSLLAQLKTPAEPRSQPAITTMGDGAEASYSARSEHWRFIRYSDGTEELYDHRSDPHEFTNLAHDAAHSATKTSLHAALPTTWTSAARPLAAVQHLSSTGGPQAWNFTNGDELSSSDAPKIAGHGIDLEVALDFNPAVDSDSTLISHGSKTNGWVLHLVESSPTLTLFVDGKKTSVSLSAIAAGPTVIRAAIAGNGTLSVAVAGQGEIIEAAPFPAGLPKQPEGPLAIGASFGPLSAQDYPNSTPLDAKLIRLWVTVLE
jgi:arylsulfatase A-like enzyme